MYFISGLVLCCAFIVYCNAWFFHQYQKGSSGRSSEEQTDDETEGPVSGKEIDWDTRGKMLFATQIITTTETTEITDNSTLDFEDDENDNITEIIELMATSPASLGINTSSTQMPSIKICSPQKIHIWRHRKGKNKADTTKRQIQKRRHRSYMENKKCFRNTHKRNGTKFSKNHTLIKKRQYNAHNTGLEQNNMKVIPRGNKVLDQDEENYSNQNKNKSLINENYKSVKRKREYSEVPLRPKDNYLDNNLWETPTCEMMGDGLDHVYVQYSKPFSVNSYHRPVIYPKKYGEEWKDEKTLDHLKTTNNARENLTDRDSEPDMKRYDIKMYDSIQPSKTHINNYMNRHNQILKGDEPFEILKKSETMSKNPELLEEKIYTNYSGVYTPTVDDILFDRRIKPVKQFDRSTNISDYVVKYKRPSANIMHCRKNAHHLPMNITIAMKHLLKHYSPTDLNISNSSYLTSDGTLKFSIELRNGTSKDV